LYVPADKPKKLGFEVQLIPPLIENSYDPEPPVGLLIMISPLRVAAQPVTFAGTTVAFNITG